MKKLLSIILIVLLLFSLASGCTPKEKSVESEETIVTKNLEDGIYFASNSDFSSNGWKYHVIITIAKGNIIDVVWNGTNRVPGPDKKTMSVNGTYGMVAFGNSQSEWHEQAELAENYLIQIQTPVTEDDFYSDEEGHTDSIAGVSINVSELFNLAKKALSSDPVPLGIYKTGYPLAALDPDDNGWQYMSQFIVVNNTIVDANFNAQSITDLDNYGNPIDKKGLGYDYGLKANGDSAYEWFEHAAMVEEYVINNQSFDVDYNDEEGHTDSIASVTISIMEMHELFNRAFDITK